MNGKENYVSLFINVLEGRKRQILSQQIDVCNYFLSKKFVEEDVLDDLCRARTLRVLNPDEAKKPKLRFISSIYSAVYEHERRIVHLGNYDKTHSSIARKADVSYGDVFSGDVFCLRAVPQSMIFVFSNSDCIYSYDLEKMNEAGYLVMDEVYRWIIPNPVSSEKITIDSPITMDYFRAKQTK